MFGLVIFPRMKNAKSVKIVAALMCVGGVIGAAAEVPAGLWVLLLGIALFVIGRFME
jgi:1,4-dihydroxy-2-naphthoate octaprenyltransferase